MNLEESRHPRAAKPLISLVVWFGEDHNPTAVSLRSVMRRLVEADLPGRVANERDEPGKILVREEREIIEVEINGETRAPGFELFASE